MNFPDIFRYCRCDSNSICVFCQVLTAAVVAGVAAAIVLFFVRKGKKGAPPAR